MNEQTKVDLLFDELVDECVCGDHNCEGCLQLIDAKLAVAELVEAAKVVVVEFGIWEGPEEPESSRASMSRNRSVRAYEGLRAALAAFEQVPEQAAP